MLGLGLNVTEPKSASRAWPLVGLSIRRILEHLGLGPPEEKSAPSALGLEVDDPRALFQDSRGWVWIGRRFKGAAVIKDPRGPDDFASYTMREGMASDAVWAVCEDNDGRMYFGTAKGVEQLDVATGRIRHIGREHGLPLAVVINVSKA